MDDEFLVQQVLAGNRQAFRLLVLRYQRPLFRFLSLLGLESGTVEDLALDTFLRAFRALGRFDPDQASTVSTPFSGRTSVALSFTVPNGQIFVLGDDRSLALESRRFGSAAVADVKGIARQVWLSISAEHALRWNRVGQVLP